MSIRNESEPVETSLIFLVKSMKLVEPVHEGPLEFTKGYTITSTFKSKDSLPFVPPTSTSIQETQDIRKSLAIYDGRDAIVDAVQNNQILIVVGDAGFRKTSQIPQYLYET
ncbi:mRNA splicing factor ATP-dependent RNA helicase, putative [Medicago truncatula]|uniref:RNA helicase n=1 Tax=Medicago truncatula TaxID=3880 RepID=G7KNH4_MEDTR|nr:mRNA splicing factor ATP-dependent RNA helicase, putative [Medicago truncatula]